LIHLNTKQLSALLKLSRQATTRLAEALNFDREVVDRRAVYTFSSNHPLMKSLVLINNHYVTKPIYSIEDLTNLWHSRKGSFSNERIRQKLLLFKVPIHNKSKKGYIYLIDLVKFLQNY
jgi:hypothetical protein